MSAGGLMDDINQIIEERRAKLAALRRALSLARRSATIWLSSLSGGAGVLSSDIFIKP